MIRPKQDTEIPVSFSHSPRSSRNLALQLSPINCIPIHPRTLFMTLLITPRVFLPGGRSPYVYTEASVTSLPGGVC